MINKIQIGMAILTVLHSAKWKMVASTSGVTGIRVAMRATATTKKSKDSRGATAADYPAATSMVPTAHK